MTPFCVPEKTGMYSFKVRKVWDTKKPDNFLFKTRLPKKAPQKSKVDPAKYQLGWFGLILAKWFGILDMIH